MFYKTALHILTLRLYSTPVANTFCAQQHWDYSTERRQHFKKLGAHCMLLKKQGLVINALKKYSLRGMPNHLHTWLRHKVTFQNIVLWKPELEELQRLSKLCVEIAETHLEVTIMEAKYQDLHVFGRHRHNLAVRFCQCTMHPFCMITEYYNNRATCYYIIQYTGKAEARASSR